jgi:anti-sigma factor RsiW
MMVSDLDLELLEEHLDGALDAAASTALARRLATDAPLAAALEKLKSHRAVRSAVWQSMEPNAVAADRLLWRVKGAIAAQQKGADVFTAPAALSSWSSWRITQFASAAAACMVLGFLVGRVGQSGSLTHPKANTDINAGNVAINSNPPANAGFTQTGKTPQVLVPISNEYGQVTWQPFDNAEQAKSFEEDLHKAQGGSMNPAMNVAPKLASQEHF